MIVTLPYVRYPFNKVDKDFPGLYRFWNRVTGKSYIGMSTSVLKRMRRHIKALNHGEHTIGCFQEEWAGGEWYLQIIPIDGLTFISRLRHLEQTAINGMLNGDLYNISLSSFRKTAVDRHYNYPEPKQIDKWSLVDTVLRSRHEHLGI